MTAKDVSCVSRVVVVRVVLCCAVLCCAVLCIEGSIHMP